MTSASLTILLVSFEMFELRQGSNLHTNLPELPVGDQKGAQCPQTIHGLVTILPSAVLIDGGTRLLCLHRAEMLSLPDEVLKQLAFVLTHDQLSSLVNDIPKVLDQCLTFLGQLPGRRRESIGLKGTVQRDIALLV